MLGASFSYSLSLFSNPLLAAATMVKGILEAADAEREEHNSFRRRGSDRTDVTDCVRGKEEEKEGQWLRQAPRATLVPQPASLFPRGQPSRRPVRPFRKRKRYVFDSSSDDRHFNPSGRASMIHFDAGDAAAAAATTTAGAAAAAAAAAAATATATAAAAAAALPSDAAASPVGTFHTRENTITTSLASLSSSLSSEPRRENRRHSRPPASSPASSATRLLSSETYLRRLFVTSALAHVLSLDACLPRTMRANREASVRVSVREATGRGRGWSVQEEAGLCGEQQHGAERGNVAAAMSISNNNDGHDAGGKGSQMQQLLLAVDEPYNSVSFTKVFPVTLIDDAGQRWNVKYVTTRRDNLHSGRLVDGWEKFCRASRLRIGDSVEFTRLETHELSFHGLEHGKEAFARVVACKKT